MGAARPLCSAPVAFIKFPCAGSRRQFSQPARSKDAGCYLAIGYSEGATTTIKKKIKRTSDSLGPLIQFNLWQ